MQVSHARATAATSTGEHAAKQVPGLLEVLALVPDPRRRRGRRYLLAFVLAVAVACALAGAKSFREIGDQALDRPQDVLTRLGGRPHPLLRRIIAPSETRIRTLVHAIGADVFDELIGGNRESDYFLFVKGNQPSLQRAIFNAIQHDGPRDPDHTELDYSHGRIIRRSNWVTGAESIGFPHASRIARIRRDRYDLDGMLISKEIVHAVTSLAEDLASPEDLARIARGQWGIESVHWLRDAAYAEDANIGYAGNGPQVMATFRNLAISLLYLAGATEITRTLQAIGRDRNRILSYLPL